MKTNGFILILILVLMFLVTIGYFGYKYYQAQAPLQSPALTKSAEIKFVGTVNDIDTGCNTEHICIADSPIKVRVDNYWLTIDLMGDPNPEMTKERGDKGKILMPDGTVVGSLPKDFSIGERVEVLAKIIDTDTLSLYGSSQYYLKILGK